MPDARNKAHVVVAPRSGNVPVLSRTKIRRLPSTKSEKNDRSTTSGPISSLQRNHLAPAASVIADNDERQRHIEKQISPDLKNSEKTKMPI